MRRWSDHHGYLGGMIILVMDAANQEHTIPSCWRVFRSLPLLAAYRLSLLSAGTSPNIMARTK